MVNAIRLQSTAGVLAERIRDEILEGGFAPGDPLPQEEIAARYGVSRSPLREALRQLEAEGWIVYHPNRGAFVAAISAKDVRDIYQLRRILEAAAIRLAVKTIDDEQLRALRNLDAAMRKAADARAALALHVQFHDTLYAACGNPKLAEDIAAHRVRVQRLPDSLKKLQAAMKRSASDHRAIFSACERRDARAAERAVLNELDHVEALMLEGLH